MPGFFQVAHPLVPMTYLVDALRVTISGGSTSQLATGLAVLAGLLVGALALTSVVAWRQRRFTSTRLHPPLEA
jgi:putative membrane protein